MTHFWRLVGPFCRLVDPFLRSVDQFLEISWDSFYSHLFRCRKNALIMSRLIRIYINMYTYFIFISFSISIYLSIYLIYLSIYVSVYQSINLFICLYISLPRGTLCSCRRKRRGYKHRSSPPKQGPGNTNKPCPNRPGTVQRRRPTKSWGPLILNCTHTCIY